MFLIRERRWLKLEHLGAFFFFSTSRRVMGRSAQVPNPLPFMSPICFVGALVLFYVLECGIDGGVDVRSLD